MKILFICGSLEPGKDGVGDYTRRLAAELKRQGNEIAILSLFDYEVNLSAVETQFSQGIAIPVLRISNAISRDKRLTIAREWIGGHKPSIISLQFVIFSFHRKGLPIMLANFLETLKGEHQWHLMLHELWVGMPIGASKKHVLWGWLQRMMIFFIIRKLNPKIVHTQSKLYQFQMEKHGFKTSYLPLFSNIPKNQDNIVKAKSDNMEVKLVLFGTIHPDAQIDELISEVICFQESQKRVVTLVIIGGSGAQKDNWIKKWQYANLSLANLGEQSPEIISATLDQSSIGIFTGALPMIDKSGTVAAMLDHGLPIICVSKRWEVLGFSAGAYSQGIFELKPGCLQASLNFQAHSFGQCSVPQVAKLLLESLA